MLYELLNKEPATEYNNPEAISNKELCKIVEFAAKTAEINYKKYIIGGGIALAIYYNKIVRKHRDLDLYILKEDFNFWKSFCETFNLVVFKNKWNKNYYGGKIINNKKIKRLIDLNFNIPNLIKENGEIKILISDFITDRWQNGITIEDAPYILKHGVRILSPEVIKEQKIGRHLNHCKIPGFRINSNIKKDSIDLASYLDISGLEIDFHEAE